MTYTKLILPAEHGSWFGSCLLKRPIGAEFENYVKYHANTIYLSYKIKKGANSTIICSI
jgi:hypothetical protein